MYLDGSLQILKDRKQIDFQLLVKLGKVPYRDIEWLVDFGDLEETRIPGFMADMVLYRKALDDIVTGNGLTDEDFASV